MTRDQSEAPAPINLAISVTKLPQNGMPVAFAPSADEMKAVADHFDIPSVEDLRGDLLVRRWKRDGVEVVGRLTGTLIQACVVTLDPVRTEMNEPIEVVFVPEHSKLARIAPLHDGELHLDPEGADIPETFSGDKIDLGIYLTEVIGLSLDPYPRADGVEFEEVETDPEPEGGRVSPFAALAQLKTRT